jgi:hypothetical protein
MMNNTMDKFKPAAGKSTLIFLSFLMWIAVGALLLSYAYSWLRAVPVRLGLLFAGAGFCAALIIHHFGFLKIVDKNLGRILRIEGKKCLFSFMTWKSYLNVVVMVAMGIGLRHSPVPKTYLAVLYTGIGLSLILSSIRYLRFFLMQIRT